MSSVISVSNLSKVYRIGKKAEKADSFVGMLQDSITAPFRNWHKMRELGNANNETDEELHWALRDVSFEVKEGEVLGVIGRNGAGKSTLLKVLSRITEPTSGKVRIKGRVASLLEVGTGFHPELTGRENVYLNGAILGMTKKEISRKFDEIVDFSGVEKFLDTPIKRYSSGMKVRLAFAVAANLDPEILIVDEVLAVGDAEFQKKCMGKMNEVSKANGKTVLFVSHNMAAIQTLCNSAILLRQGRLVEQGAVVDLLELHTEDSVVDKGTKWTRASDCKLESNFFIGSVEVETIGNQPYVNLVVRVIAHSVALHPRSFIAVDIHDLSGGWLMQAVPNPTPFIQGESSTHEIEIRIDLPPLIPGVYPVSVWVGSTYHHTVDWAREVVNFSITESPTSGRTVPHSATRGFCVPRSKVALQTRENLTQ